MPLSVTEILPTSGTGLNSSALGAGADDALTAQPLGAGLLTGPAPGALVAHAAMNIVAAAVAVAINARLVSRW
jgi:hypothetical protein